MHSAVTPRWPDWPLEMVADTAAAFFNFSSTRAFLKAVRSGEYPGPSALRSKGKAREPIWYRPHLTRHADQRHGQSSGCVTQADAAELI